MPWCSIIPKLWQHYLKQFSLEQDAKIYFRDKSTGWDQFIALQLNKKNQFQQPASQNEYMKVFLKDLCLRPSCYDCHIRD